MTGEALLLLPAASAILYVVATLFLKRAIHAGCGQRQVNLFTNLVAGVCFQGLWLLSDLPDWSEAWRPCVTGGLFIVGQIFTFLALRHGEVSVATPLLGVKVLFTAIFAAFLFREAIEAKWWLGAAASTVGVMLVTGASWRSLGPRLLEADALCSLGAAAAFALTDVFVQRWTPILGVTAFIPLMFGSVTILSLLLFVPTGGLEVFRFRGGAGTGALFGGSAFYAMQAMGMAVALGLQGNATAVNIVYSSRSIWGVVLAWMLSRHFETTAPAPDRAVMQRRMAGACLVFVAVVAVLL